MTSPELFERLDGLELSFDVANHLAVLDEDQIDELREKLNTTPAAAERVQSRVKSGLIRRRRKKSDGDDPAGPADTGVEAAPAAPAAVAAPEPVKAAPVAPSEPVDEPVKAPVPSFLNETRRMQVEHDDVRRAYDAALASRGSAGPPAEGAVGSGTGMSCFDFKGGIGTASRLTGAGHTVGVLLMTNFGLREECVVAGVPLGRLLGPTTSGPHAPAGSCIGIVVTDAPVDGASCSRLARRVGLGLARTGSVAHHGSGEIFMAFGTGLRLDRDGHQDGTLTLSGRTLDPLFSAVVEATEEAVLNSLFAAPTALGRDDHASESIYSPTVMELLSGAGGTPS